MGVVGNGAAIFPEREGLSGRAVQTSAYNASEPMVMLASHRHAPKRVEALMSSLAHKFAKLDASILEALLSSAMWSPVPQMYIHERRPVVNGMWLLAMLGACSGRFGYR